ncbi:MULTISPECIES: nuclease-related domain-containing protein [unclassified Modestobacter]|uniref:nuclease-related domain-containing protein n=1 Tax=unclassified Modestobacter TaxID=2643866 RepID=UPI0022AB31FA|nr:MULTISPECIES: nuclease-related domain-containing protein [unclassified Modestobacter]MCZ2826672.1 nuclease-related domain-containing protein [Modestobacter sp. VKM Ac-2981]MCZ2855052.1 nuclease-related domain-containing protein [Modestobacter sp. VKM Ac-2982]
MAMLRRSPSAGRFAEGRYRELRSHWRRRISRRLLLLVAITWTTWLLVSWLGDGWVRWYGGFMLGAFVMMAVAVWTTPPESIQRWGAGAEGERRTARELKALERRGWHMTHDLDWPGAGNIDHLVIGTGGIFVIDSKAWNGVVSVDDAGATITPRDDADRAWTERGQRNHQIRAARAVARALAARSGAAVPAPHSVVAVWAPFPQRVAVSGDVTYVAGDQLTDWLHSRPRQLSREQVALASVAVGADLLSEALPA